MTRFGKYLFSAFLLLAFVGCGGDSANKPSTSHANTSNTSNTNNTSNSDSTSNNTSTSNNASQTQPQILANAGDDVAVQVNTPVNLEASGNYDGYENITYEWFENDKLLSNEQSFTKSDFSVGVHEITLKVYGDTISRANKNQIAQDTKKVIISLNPPTNLPPHANTDTSKQAIEGQSITFDASSSTDEDVSSLSYKWYEGDTLLSDQKTFDKNDFSLGMHYVKLVVTDSSGLSSKKVVWVKVGADITKDEPILREIFAYFHKKFTHVVPAYGGGYELEFSWYCINSEPQQTQLPSIIGKLKYVKELQLSGYHIATLPDEFANLTQLETFYIYSLALNNNSYDFPPQLLKLPNLYSITLSFPINSIPEKIQNLKKLEWLRINISAFKSLSSEIAKLKNLKKLSDLTMTDYQTSLPDEIALLKNLDTIGYDTNFSNISHDIELLSQLPKLKFLNIRTSLDPTLSNTSLPSNIKNLSNLEELSNYGSSISLPPEINELSNLKRILINTAMDVLPTLNNLKKLEVLEILDENLTTFPQDISELTSLENINFIGGKFETLPKGINKLQNLKKLELLRTSLSTLPPEIGELSKLYELVLISNKQLVALPSEIGNLKNLRELDLGNNNLKTLPKQITKLKNLGYLEFRLNGNNNLCVNDPEIIEFLKSKGVSESEYSHCK